MNYTKIKSAGMLFVKLFCWSREVFSLRDAGYVSFSRTSSEVVCCGIFAKHDNLNISGAQDESTVFMWLSNWRLQVWMVHIILSLGFTDYQLDMFERWKIWKLNIFLVVTSMAFSVGEMFTTLLQSIVNCWGCGIY